VVAVFSLELNQSAIDVAARIQLTQRSLGKILSEVGLSGTPGEVGFILFEGFLRGQVEVEKIHLLCAE